MRGLSSYQSVSQQSASPVQMIGMLYERAIRDQRSAIQCIEDGNSEEVLTLLRRTREIFIELASALDHDVAPELSGNLHRLYTWAVRELLVATRDSDAVRVQNILTMTEELHEAWSVVIDEAS